MAKKDISTILKGGSAKQRILLFAENYARLQYFMEPILTTSEASALEQSFKSDSEIKIWNKFNRMHRAVSTSLQNLQGISFEIMMHKSDLRGYIILWNAIEEAELLANSLLHEIKDTEERKRISSQGIKAPFGGNIDILFSDTKVDDEGYIELNVDFARETFKGKKSIKDEPKMTRERSLMYAIERVRNQLITTVSDYNSWSKALYDYMNENGFNIKAYKERLEKLNENVHSNIVGWHKYLQSFSGFEYPSGSSPMDSLKDEYSVVPSLSEVPINEERYNWFRKTFLEED